MGCKMNQIRKGEKCLILKSIKLSRQGMGCKMNQICVHLQETHVCVCGQNIPKYIANISDNMAFIVFVILKKPHT